MDNSTRRQLLDKARSTGFPGSILEVFTAYDQGRDLVQEYVQQQQMQPQMQVAQTPQEQEQGLRPAHEAGNVNQSMAFPDVQPGQSFSTIGMKVPINIDKVDNQGNLVESFKAVPPGIQNLPTGPYKGTVIESPARMKTGGVKTDPPTKKKIYTDPLKFAKAKEIHDDSLSDYLKNKNIYESYSGAVYKQTYDEIAELAEKNKRDYGWAKSNYPQKPKVEPVYKEKPIEYIPIKTPKLERDPLQLIIPQSDRTLMPYNNTLDVLRAKQKEDKSDKNLYPTKVVKAPEFKTGGVKKYQTAGFETPAADATAVKVNPLVKQIDLTNYQEANPVEQQSKFDYQGYYDKANKYLSRPIFKGTALTAKDIADAAQDFYGSTNYEYPLDLLLTQGQLETKLGKTLKSQHNYFNVGNTDSGATRDFPSAKDSVKNYMDLMYNDYLAKGQKTPEDLLKPQGFVNYRGARYASAPNYEVELDKQRQYISGYINKLEMGGSYQTNQEISMYEWRTGRPEESRKRYIVGGLKNRVLYNKAKYKR